MQPEPPPYLLPAILVAFPIFFVGMWTLISAIIAAVSGWGAMATRYPLPPTQRGQSLPSGWAIRVGIANYRGTMSFEALPEGLVIRVMRLFPFHPPLLVPWRAIRLQRGGSLFAAGTMAVDGGATFSLNGDAFQSIEGALARATGPAAFG